MRSSGTGGPFLNVFPAQPAVDNSLTAGQVTDVPAVSNERAVRGALETAGFVLDDTVSRCVADERPADDGTLMMLLRGHLMELPP